MEQRMVPQYAPQNVTRKRTHRFGPQDDARRALSQTYPCIEATHAQAVPNFPLNLIE